MRKATRGHHGFGPVQLDIISVTLRCEGVCHAVPANHGLVHASGFYDGFHENAEGELCKGQEVQVR